MVLLAAHRPAPSVLPVYQVKSLEATKSELSQRGWKPKAGPVEIPDGPAYIFEDPSGNETAIFEQTRPEHLVESYREKTEKSNAKPSDLA